ncbi:hypothetical protein OM219_22125 [Escherichia albertii]|nr:hypothetical protein [Escherichia albertii]
MAQAGTGAACGVTLLCRWRDQSDALSGAGGKHCVSGAGLRSRGSKA